MRISGGQFRGRMLKTPKGDATRPTSGMVREVLFNVLAADIPDARVLDLFAGSGSVGLEALGRGAAHSTLVESARPALACLKDNITLLGVAGETEVLPIPVARALDAFARQGATFDLIFLDPPFADAPAYLQVLEAIAISSLLAEDGVLVAQHDRRLHLPDEVGTLTRDRLKPIGDNALSFYRKDTAHSAADST
jgi:16S rRNA (guanine966-N2)-methyltransferase